METDGDRIITFVVPCYNSAAYMDRCIESLVKAAEGASDVEVLVIDDGSAEDDTLERALGWQRRHPGLVRAIHQDNGGHGEVINTGLAQARGAYFKVVDSDDWVDVDAARAVLARLRELRASGGAPLDMLVANYVYEHESDGTRLAVRYVREFPQDRVFTWDDMLRPFPPWQYMMMHSVVYRTALLRACGLRLPAHTFYVDEIFVYAPLPHVRTILYLDVDLYHYLIGRAGQSVEEKVMTARVDQQLRVGRIKIDSVDIPSRAENRKLRRYMIGDLTITMCICTAFSILSDRPDHLQLRDDIWAHLKAHDRRLWHRIRWSFIGIWCNLRTPLGLRAFVWGYHKMQSMFKFN